MVGHCMSLPHDSFTHSTYLTSLCSSKPRKLHYIDVKPYMTCVVHNQPLLKDKVRQVFYAIALYPCDQFQSVVAHDSTYSRAKDKAATHWVGCGGWL